MNKNGAVIISREELHYSAAQLSVEMRLAQAHRRLQSDMLAIHFLRRPWKTIGKPH